MSDAIREPSSNGAVVTPFNRRKRMNALPLATCSWRLSANAQRTAIRLGIASRGAASTLIGT